MYSDTAKSIAFALVLLSIAGSAAADGQSYKRDIELAIRSAIAVGEDPAPCLSTIGRETAFTLIRYCRAVSQATHPPCNTGNDCALIVHEITRTCRPAPLDLIPCSKMFQPEDWQGISELEAQ